MIVKAILLIVIELIIYGLVGTLVCSIVARDRKVNIAVRVIEGFLCYQILFQLCALPFIMLRRSLTELTICWNVLIGIILVISIWRNRKQLINDIANVFSILKQYPLYCGAGIAAVMFVCIYVSLNGRLDDDSIYYIGLVNTTLESDMMFRRNVYSGELVPSLYLRRILVTFEINSAVLAKTFGIHPIILMRVMRGSMNVIFTALSIREIGKLVYQKREETERGKKSIVFMVIALFSNFLMNNTYYTGATFLLNRAYEGKAYAGNTLILFTTYLCMELAMEQKKENYLWLIVMMWASLAISTSAIVVNAVAIVAWLMVCWINKKCRTIKCTSGE